ncbi:MAG: hypothetical protein WBY88_04565 [Desulfosarcina sp.]
MHYFLPYLIHWGRPGLIAVVMGLLVSGCTSFSAHHSQFRHYRQPMAVMLMLPPEIGIFEQLSDGSRLYREQYSRTAQRRAQEMIAEQLRLRHFEARAVDPGMINELPYTEIISLFRSVNHSIQLHTFGPQPYPAKRKAFEYDLGPVVDIMTENGVDGLVLAIGHQTGFEPALKNWFSIAIVEPQGRIIWYGMTTDCHQYDFQRQELLAKQVADTLNHFWEAVP